MLRTGGSGKQEVLEVQAIEDVAVVADQEALHAMLQLAAVAYPPTVLRCGGKSTGWAWLDPNPAAPSGSSPRALSLCTFLASLQECG
mmetsp:Transcript_126351/g.246370  ORF Transcript_126351/g.246370 Transcript_126351/m.246370 type:complete len:87 (-) Transcript_126351:396-656(-)